MEHRWTLDRFEGSFAVVEVGDGSFLDLPRWMLPENVDEGAHLVVHWHDGQNGERVIDVAVDRAATDAAREQVHATLERLRSRDPGGDITL